MADLDHLKRTGRGEEIVAAARQGIPIVGICGGYQMLGERILDPERVESVQSEAWGLGLLPVTTTFPSVKSTHQIKGRVLCDQGLLEGASQLALVGYEIHMGQITGAGRTPPFQIQERSGTPCEDLDGCLSTEGKVLGTYIHGLFHNEALRRALLTKLATGKGVALPLEGEEASKDERYDRLAGVVRSSLDTGLLYRIAGLHNE